MLQRMKMKNRLMLGFGILLGELILISIMALYGYKNADNNLIRFVNGPLEAEDAVYECRLETNIAARNVRDMVINTDTSAYPAYIEKIESNLAGIKANIQALEESDTIDAALLQVYKTNMNDWMQTVAKVMQTVQAGDREAASQMILQECTPALEDVIEIVQQMQEIVIKEEAAVVRLSNVTTVVVSVIVVVVCLVAVGFCYIISKKIINSITHPLSELQRVAQEMAQGNLKEEITYQSSDEIGMLADSLRSSFTTLSSYIRDIDGTMAMMASGDFNISASKPFIGDFKSIQTSIDNFSDRISETLNEIQSTSQQVAAGSGQIAQTAQSLAEGATEQSNLMQELSATVIDITDRINQNANNADVISEEATGVEREVEISNDKMQDMIEAMSQINETSDKISAIIQTINSIASQTNLLALNASIEAARAGDAGKGFAVVADEVGKLAMESGEAAKVSTQLITESLKAVGDGMTTAEEMNRELGILSEGAKKVTTKIAEIAVASREQADSIDQINDAVEQINQVIEGSTSAAEEGAATSEQLTSQADVLRRLIDQFNTKK